MTEQRKVNPLVVEALRDVLAERKRLFEEEPAPQNPEEKSETPLDTPLPGDSEDVPVEVEGDEGQDIELFVPSPDSLGEIDDYKFVDVLNRFRASPSFSEGEPRNQFDNYWASLQPSERHFVYITMLGFTQIALQGAKAVDAVHPHNYDLSAKALTDGDEEVVDGGLLPADKAAADLPVDHVAPIVVGEGGRSKKWRQANVMRLKNLFENE
jgi:hypothetical protein